MKTFKARGVVLREYEAGESDKRLVLLCKEHGRLTVYARGARKPKSKFLTCAQAFTYGDYILTDGRQFLSLAQGDVIESFYGIREDYTCFCNAHYVAEICEKTVLENTALDDLLLLLLKTLSHLNRSAKAVVAVSPEQAARVFLFRFFLSYGLAPETSVCSVCGKTSAIENGRRIFFSQEGLLCVSCAPSVPRKISLSADTWAALRHILLSGVTEAFLFRAPAYVTDELAEAGRLCWNGHFQIKLQSEIK